MYLSITVPRKIVQKIIKKQANTDYIDITRHNKYFFSTLRNNDETNNIGITYTKSSQNNVAKTYTIDDDTALVDSLLKYTSSLVEKSGTNIIAFSGGIDSSLAALLVHKIFHENFYENKLKVGGDGGNVKAVIGVSSSLPQRQLDLARSIAQHINIDLLEVPTTEGNDEMYIANQGKACFVCKNHLYSALEAVASTAATLSQSLSSSHNQNDRIIKTTLFNGTNADDTKDPTRLGLLSAKSFSVKSPLINITKDEVRRAAKHLNLPNWNYAASPCLRSRLALGVEATNYHLKAVNKAEEKVRQLLSLDETVNLRVRMLAGKRAMIELDQHLIEMQTSLEDILREGGFEEFCGDLGFTGGIGVRAFKTGSVSTGRNQVV